MLFMYKLQSAHRSIIEHDDAVFSMPCSCSYVSCTISNDVEKNNHEDFRKMANIYALCVHIIYFSFDFFILKIMSKITLPAKIKQTGEMTRQKQVTLSGSQINVLFC